jgi:hypothetical protein
MVLSLLPTAGLAALQLLASITEPAPRTAGSGRHFPRLAEQKAALSTVVVVADVAEFEMSGARPSTVYVEDCRALGGRLADTLAAALAAKGYRVRALPAVGVGLGADEARSCRVFQRWAQRSLDASAFPKAAAPFYADSSLAGTVELRDEWQTVMKSAFTWKPANPKKGPPAVFAGTAALRDPLGADYVLVAVGRGTKHANMGQPPFAAGQMGSAKPPAWTGSKPLPLPGSGPPPWPSTEPSPWPGSQVRIALIDCRDGTVLWADRTYTWQGFSDGRLDGFAHDLAAAMP